MWINYLKTSVRALFRNKALSLLNLLGLALGIASCLLIYLFLRHEWTYESAHPNAAHVYRIVRYSDLKVNDASDHWNDAISALMTDAIRGQLESIDKVVQFDTGTETLLDGDRPITEKLIYAQQEFFSMLGTPFIEGDLSTALAAPDRIVLTTSAAEKYFPDGDAMGKELQFRIEEETKTFTVTGIIEPMPTNTILKRDLYLPFHVIREQLRDLEEKNDWGFTFSQALVSTQPGVSRETAQSELQAFIASLGQSENERARLETCLQPLTDVYMSLDNPRGMPTESKPTGTYILGAIGLAILAIAVINFTTLTIGAASGRIKEVSVRKVLGAQRGHVKKQLAVEIALLTLVSLVLGLIVAEMALPLFNTLSERELEFRLDGMDAVVLGILWLILSVSAGTYPALVLSSFPPLAAFRGRFILAKRSTLRRGLVFVQLALSIGLVAVTLVMGRQLDFLMNRDLGYNGEQVVELSVPNRSAIGAELIERMRNSYRNDPGIVDVTGASNHFDGGRIWFTWEADGQKYEEFMANFVDPRFTEVMGIEVVAGRSFDPDRPDDLNRGIMVNETLVKRMGWDNPLGKRLPGGFHDHEVIGVVRDYHHQTLHKEIRPLVLAVNSGIIFSMPLQCGWTNWPSIQNVLVRLSGNDISATMERLRGDWPDLAPGFPFDYKFVDESVGKQYADERRWNSIVSVASVFAMVIAAMGLLGLSLIQVRQRTKELGIRKVLGAGEMRLIVLLTREFTLLVLAAGAVAAPVSVLVLRRWLDSFAYRVELTALPLVGAAAVTLLVAWLTVGWLAWRAAQTDPVKTLRYE
ncbi:FtsX-like permease family protein [bacterium]|nr:FtsX-like permease family protein [bacterium]